jgi:hypothetical protein
MLSYGGAFLEGSVAKLRTLYGRRLVGLVEVPMSVPGGTISLSRSRISSVSATSTPASKSSSCSMVRGPRSALVTPG